MKLFFREKLPGETYSMTEMIISQISGWARLLLVSTVNMYIYGTPVKQRSKLTNYNYYNKV